MSSSSSTKDIINDVKQWAEDIAKALNDDDNNNKMDNVLECLARAVQLQGRIITALSANCNDENEEKASLKRMRSSSNNNDNNNIKEDKKTTDKEEEEDTTAKKARTSLEEEKEVKED